jgi:hypothetical protein
MLMKNKKFRACGETLRASGDKCPNLKYHHVIQEDKPAFKAYDRHHRAVHGVKALESTFRGLRIESTQHLEPVNLSGRTKAEIVHDTETKIRYTAWTANKLNPLIGTTNIDAEPIWNDKKEIL